MEREDKMETIHISLKYGNGNIFRAEYTDPLIAEYQGNPLIEALPHVMSEEEAADALKNVPLYNPKERILAPEVRNHCVERLFNYFEPMSIHLKLEQKLSMLVRQGYINRHPLTPEHVNRFQVTAQNIGNIFNHGNVLLKGASQGFSITGVSGVGKSASVNRVINTYPQVLIHSQFNGFDCFLYQVVWLKIDCPYNGSPRGLCINFFNAMDRILATNYQYTYCRNRANTETMLAAMAEIASLHCMGVLVIDEIQNITCLKTKDREEMIEFLSALITLVKIPLVIVGNENVTKTFEVLGLENIVWPRLSKDDNWDKFLTGIWCYQWTDEKSDLTNELVDVFFEESVGIVDIAVKLYALAQWELIAEGQGKITPDLVRKVANNSLHLIKPMLEALKTGN